MYAASYVWLCQPTHTFAENATNPFATAASAPLSKSTTSRPAHTAGNVCYSDALYICCNYCLTVVFCSQWDDICYDCYCTYENEPECHMV